ncbi:hypothetical protein [Candidatus Frankia alpina]|uniref:hypothetical protein n=1 Tax=Candidatus Frankia alpina TaxID=2699483 RepID=UPI0030139302
MSTVDEVEPGRLVASVKGAPEAVLARCVSLLTPAGSRPLTATGSPGSSPSSPPTDCASSPWPTASCRAGIRRSAAASPVGSTGTPSRRICGCWASSGWPIRLGRARPRPSRPVTAPVSESTSSAATTP